MQFANLSLIYISVFVGRYPFSFPSYVPLMQQQQHRSHPIVRTSASHLHENDQRDLHAQDRSHQASIDGGLRTTDPLRALTCRRSYQSQPHLLFTFPSFQNRVFLNPYIYHSLKGEWRRPDSLPCEHPVIQPATMLP